MARLAVVLLAALPALSALAAAEPYQGAAGETALSAALAAQDECLAADGTPEECALNALQHRMAKAQAGAAEAAAGLRSSAKEGREIASLQDALDFMLREAQDMPDFEFPAGARILDAKTLASVLEYNEGLRRRHSNKSRSLLETTLHRKTVPGGGFMCGAAACSAGSHCCHSVKPQFKNLWTCCGPPDSCEFLHCRKDGICGAVNGVGLTGEHENGHGTPMCFGVQPTTSTGPPTAEDEADGAAAGGAAGEAEGDADEDELPPIQDVDSTSLDPRMNFPGAPGADADLFPDAPGADADLFPDGAGADADLFPGGA